MSELQTSHELRIEQFEGVYAPTTDSNLLLDAFAEHGPSETATVLDLCCGSGIQGIAAALRGHCVDAVDADRQAVISARRNAALNGVTIAVRHGDLFEPVSVFRYSDILVNPPYVPTPTAGEVDRHRWSDGGANGRSVIDRICREARDHLEPRGALWIVQSSLAGTRRTVGLLEEFGFDVDCMAEHEEPFGPVSLERLEYLRDGDFAGHDDTSEILTVLRAQVRSG